MGVIRDVWKKRSQETQPQRLKFVVKKLRILDMTLAQERFSTISNKNEISLW